MPARLIMAAARHNLQHFAPHVTDVGFGPKSVRHTPISVCGMERILHFSSVRAVWFCFLPDACYDAWANKLSEEQLIVLDLDLAEYIPKNNAQMYLLLGYKK